MKQVSAAVLLEKLAQEEPVYLLELRPEHFSANALAGSRPLSLAALQAGDVPDIAKTAPVYLICERGAVSELAGLYLEAAGFSEVYSVTGGLRAYRALQTKDLP